MINPRQNFTEQIAELTKERDEYQSLYFKNQSELREREDSIDKLAKMLFEAKKILFKTTRLVNEAILLKGLGIHTIDDMKIRMGDIVDGLQMINTALKFLNNKP